MTKRSHALTVLVITRDYGVYVASADYLKTILSIAFTAEELLKIPHLQGVSKSICVYSIYLRMMVLTSPDIMADHLRGLRQLLPMPLQTVWRTMPRHSCRLGLPVHQGLLVPTTLWLVSFVLTASSPEY